MCDGKSLQGLAMETPCVGKLRKNTLPPDVVFKGLIHQAYWPALVIYAIKRQIMNTNKSLDMTLEALQNCVAGFESINFDDAPCAMQARAAIAALQAEPQGWMPIETAPKNKVLLLGYFNAAGRWRTVRGEWFSQEEIDEQWEFPENGSPGWYETCVNADEPPNCWPIEPTHWMPLPTPPKD